MAGRKKSDQIREAIVHGAAEVFSRREFHEVLTDDIAARVGVGKGTLYRYFRSKEELYLAAIGDGLRELHGSVTEVLSQPSPLVPTIERLVRTLIEYFWDKRDFFVLMHRLEPKLKAKERAEWRERRDQIVEMLRRRLDRAMQNGEIARVHPRIATEALLGMIRGACVYRQPSDRPREVAQTITQLFLGGLFGSERPALSPARKAAASQ
ncbi:MAG: TetR family transcriptional regulator [Candidatus Binatia bacterium]|nr:MAG: TetR family transcriptional regulator [Candidatus Binatia bacterium]